MSHSRRKKKTKWKKRLVLATLTVILISIGYGVFVGLQAKDALGQSHVDLERKDDKSDYRDESVAMRKDPISILLMGVENYSTNGENGRADTQIVMTIDPDKNEISMVTVPRDTRVKIDNAGEYTGIHKINAAYNYGSLTGYGGEKLQIETVEKLLNIPIDHFVTVNFNGFRDIVDALGGVDINIKEGFWEKNIYQHGERIYFEQGQAHLNGEEALAFVRMRKRPANVSYSRSLRQRQFLNASVDQVISAGTIFKVGKITDILGENVKTDLDEKEIYYLEKQLSLKKNISMKTIEINGSEKMVGNSSYFIPDQTSLEEVCQQLRQNLRLEKAHSFTTNAE
ncbi:MAG: LCP family protein [Anaerobacillus sp.]